MLNDNDKAWMLANRAEVVAGRETETELVRSVVTGEDPYTDENITEEQIEVVSAVWQNASAGVKGDVQLIDGYEIEAGDMLVSFADAIDLSDVRQVIHDGYYYTLISTRPEGVGDVITRYECIARRTT